MVGSQQRHSANCSLTLIGDSIMTQLTKVTPSFFNKSLVGFDRMFDDLEHRFSNPNTGNYPPYNIAKISDDLYEISIAVTGFDKSEVTVQVESNVLTIVGKRLNDEPEQEYLHRGLALRDFERVFTLAEHMEVTSAEVTNGILAITLEREIPEAMKPRVIDIK